MNSWLSGTSWRKKAAEKKEWQEFIFYELKAQQIPKPLEIPLKIVATQFCAHPRDVDNGAIIATKFLLDTLKTSGYMPNDTPDIITEITLRSEKCVLKQERTEFQIAQS